MVVYQIRMPAPFHITQESAFIQSCANGALSAVKQFLRTNPLLVNQAASNGKLPLMFAAQGGHEEIIQLLLSHNANVNAAVQIGPSYQGTTALWWAAKEGRWGVVKALLEKEADPNVSPIPESGMNCEHEGETPLMFAAMYGSLDAVDLLLSHKAAVDAAVPTGPHKGTTALWFAVTNGSSGVVKALLEKGANPNVSPETGYNQGLTPLMWATMKGNLDVVRLLLSHKSNVDAIGRDWHSQEVTALGLAADRAKDEVFRLLLNQGASIDSKRINQVLQTPALEGSNTQITWSNVKALFRLAKNESKLSTEALQLGLKRVLQNLAEEPYPALNGQMNGETALHLAIKANNQPIIAGLILAGADSQLPNRAGETAQSLLAQSGVPDIQTLVKWIKLKELFKKFNLPKTLSSGQEDGKERKESLESKEGKEELETAQLGQPKMSEKTIEEVNQLAREILDLADNLTPKVRNKICYDLGELLETFRDQDPRIELKAIVDAFSQVSREDEDEKQRYQKACGRLAHYKVLLSGRDQGLESEGLEDSDPVDTAVLALCADRHIEPGVFSHAILSGLFPSGQLRTFGLTSSRGSHEEALKDVLSVARKEILKRSVPHQGAKLPVLEGEGAGLAEGSGLSGPGEESPRTSPVSAAPDPVLFSGGSVLPPAFPVVFSPNARDQSGGVAMGLKRSLRGREREARLRR